MENSPLEFLARQYDNVIKYDRDGNPSIFVKFPKMKSSDLDPSLPNHTHPAFIINGVEQDYILLGKYKGCCMDGGSSGTIYSLPNMPPAYYRTYDNMLTQCRAFGNGATGMTAADHGFIMLLAQKNGWDPHGNTYYGHYYGEATLFSTNAAVKTGDKRGWRGYLWECIQNHTTSDALAPDIAPAYWKKLKKIGGTEAYTDLHTEGRNNLLITLNGSGPMDWYLDGTPGSMCDVVGNLMEHNYGYRVQGAELQILPNNDAADPNANLSANSTAWKAILPHSGDDGYDLVAPGTPGTVHWTFVSSKLTLDTVQPTLDKQDHGTYFKDLAVNSSRVPYIPCILRELGLFPTPGSTMKGYVLSTLPQPK